MNRGWDEKTKRSGPREKRNSVEKNKPLKHLFLTFEMVPRDAFMPELLSSTFIVWSNLLFE